MTLSFDGSERRKIELDKINKVRPSIPADEDNMLLTEQFKSYEKD